MTAPIAGLPISSAPDKKKRVLLVDGCQSKRDIRAETMRRLGAEVDCAADISEARGWWKPDLYDLVLIHVEEELPHRDKFCDDVRSAAPGQQIGFLVGKPDYITAHPHGKESSAADLKDSILPLAPTRVGLAMRADVSPGWGILEACRRISAVRSVADARARALRDRPLPPRDLETAARKRAQTVASQLLVESEGKEMQ